MMTHEVMVDNCGTWDQLLVFLELLPFPELKDRLLPIIQSAVAAGINRYFRGGTSMSHLIFSTSERNGLEEINSPPPRVTLAVDEDSNVYLAWSHGNLWFMDPERKDVVTPATALSMLKSYLAQLWIETRPTEPVPKAVKEL